MEVLMGKSWEIIYKLMSECENHLQIVFMISEDQSANFTGEEHPCTTGIYQKNMPYWDAPSVEP
jgi:hypothetical protein